MHSDDLAAFHGGDESLRDVVDVNGLKSGRTVAGHRHDRKNQAERQAWKEIVAFAK
jgi:hypothetical protein